MNAAAEVTPKFIPKDDYSKMIKQTQQDNASDCIEIPPGVVMTELPMIGVDALDEFFLKTSYKVKKLKFTEDTYGLITKLTDVQFYRFLQALVFYKRVNHLDLSYLSIGGPQFTSICHLLPWHYKNVKILDFTGNNLDDDNAETLCENITDNKTLEKLILTRNEICDVSLDSIADCIKTIPTLKSLCLQSNRFSDRGADVIVQSLLLCPYITTFKLGRLRDSGEDTITEDKMKDMMGKLSETRKWVSLNIGYFHFITRHTCCTIQ